MGAPRIDRTHEFLRLTGAPAEQHASDPKTSAPFLQEATELRHDLVNLEELVRSVESKYVQASAFIRIKGNARMSEREKDEVDSDITEFVKNCSLKIDALQDSTQKPHSTVSLLEHEKEVIAYLLERLKATAAAAKHLQKQRVALTFLTSQRLVPNRVRLALADRESELVRTTTDRSADPMDSLSTHSLSTTEMQRRKASVPKPPAVQHAPVFASQNDTIEFTEEQQVRFHAENVTLHRHFQENVEDAKQMEAKMAEISNLVSQFTDKLIEQDSEIQMIHDYAQETSSNIKQSNKILEKTQQVGNGYGFMIFCFYAFFSLLLHALHYFND